MTPHASRIISSVDDEQINLRDFLENSNLAAAKVPPWVHSTNFSRIYKIRKSGSILATPCSVFKPEKLCYCFIGRPAYKRDDIDNPQLWELPMVFVMRFANPPPIKRIFPFDSGAFKTGRLPDYITEFDISGYELSSDTKNIGRLISLLYKSPEKYMSRSAAGFEEINQEYDLTIQHQEIMAVARLALDNSNRKCDDRAAAIEISLGQDIPLLKEDILGIVIPDEVKRVKHLMDWLSSLTNFVETYRHHPLSLHQHYGIVYEAVRNIYKKCGVQI